jgi:hypothetical protein
MRPILQGRRPAAAQSTVPAQLPYCCVFDALASDALISWSLSLHHGEADRDGLTSTILQPCPEARTGILHISVTCAPTALIVSMLQDGIEVPRKRVRQSI